MSGARATSSTAAWEALRAQLDNWAFTDAFALTVGNASGPLFAYTKGGFTLRTRVETASTSKWPLALMMLGLVADNTIPSLDAPVASYTPWWTQAKTDPKARVTMRHLLSFTSGFGDGAPGKENGTKTCMDSATASFLPCAKAVYRSTKLTGLPGRTYTYNSVHLQLAGAVAMTASSLTIQQLLSKYLFHPYDMHLTSCEMPSAANPQLAICLNTTALDYEQFLLRTLRHDVLPKELVDESERDATPFLSDYYTLYGNYGFGHFLECFDSVDGFTDECKAARVHADPGAFGFYPLIDRRLGYYMQIVAYQTGRKDYPRSGIPEYLRLLAKPLVDAAIQGKDAEAEAFGHHSPRLNSLSIADLNYVADCFLHPNHCQ